MKKIFLLGGYDLEMIEIRNLLQQQGLMYFDRELNWSNASLTQYADIIAEHKNRDNIQIYGFELTEKGIQDIPSNYYRIDHHNDFGYKISSLEQVAEILDIKLNHYQQLVAANDSGYIPAMKAMGATEAEIEEIRRKDRAAQGVTKEDELLAEKSIEEKIEEKGITVIKAYSSRFSPICDRLYPYNKLLIYTDDELMYYGKGKDHLVEIFAEEIANEKMFHGGDNNGYLGTVKGIFSGKEIITLKEKIISFLTLNS